LTLYAIEKANFEAGNEKNEIKNLWRRLGFSYTDGF